MALSAYELLSCVAAMNPGELAELRGRLGPVFPVPDEDEPDPGVRSSHPWGRINQLFADLVAVLGREGVTLKSATTLDAGLEVLAQALTPHLLKVPPICDLTGPDLDPEFIKRVNAKLRAAIPQPGDFKATVPGLAVTPLASAEDRIRGYDAEASDRAHAELLAGGPGDLTPRVVAHQPTGPEAAAIADKLRDDLHAAGHYLAPGLDPKAATTPPEEVAALKAWGSLVGPDILQAAAQARSELRDHTEASQALVALAERTFTQSARYQARCQALAREVPGRCPAYFLPLFAFLESFSDEPTDLARAAARLGISPPFLGIKPSFPAAEPPPPAPTYAQAKPGRGQLHFDPASHKASTLLGACYYDHATGRVFLRGGTTPPDLEQLTFPLIRDVMDLVACREGIDPIGIDHLPGVVQQLAADDLPARLGRLAHLATHLAPSTHKLLVATLQALSFITTDPGPRGSDDATTRLYAVGAALKAEPRDPVPLPSDFYFDGVAGRVVAANGRPADPRRCTLEVIEAVLAVVAGREGFPQDILGRPLVELVGDMTVMNRFDRSHALNVHAETAGWDTDTAEHQLVVKALRALNCPPCICADLPGASCYRCRP